MRIISSLQIQPEIVNNDTATLQLDDCTADILMNSCSSALSEKVMVQRLVSSVQVASPFNDSEEPRTIGATASWQRHARVTPAEVSRKFFWGLETARKTLKCTTQFGVRTALNPFTRRYKPDILQNYHRRLKSPFYTDTMFQTVVSTRGNKAVQVFTNGKYVNVQPMKSKSEAGLALKDFIDEVGVPSKITCDGAKEEVMPGTEFRKTLRWHHIDWAQTEPYTHRQNRAEDCIREVRRRWRMLTSRREVPRRLWDYALVHISRIMCLTARGDDDHTPYEELTGETPDISEYIDFQFYDWVYYVDNPYRKEEAPKLGRWLGVSHRASAAMCFYVLARNGQILSRSSVQHVPIDEQLSSETARRMEEFTLEVNGRLSDTRHRIPMTEENAFYIEDDVGDDPDPQDDNVIDPNNPSPIVDADEVWSTPDAYDQYIGAEVHISHGDADRRRGIVRKRKRDEEGNPIGRRHNNFMMDTRLYEVEFDDGTTEEFYANTIAENLFSQVDSEGRTYLLMKEISDHKCDGHAIKQEDGWFTTPSGNRRRKRTTKGWELLVEWKEGYSDWVPLKDLKDSYPVEVAEYAKANGLGDEPAFAW